LNLDTVYIFQFVELFSAIYRQRLVFYEI